MWLAKLRAERYSERTVHMYGYLAGRYLEGNPEPTKLEIQAYLAKMIGGRVPRGGRQREEGSHEPLPLPARRGAVADQPTKRGGPREGTVQGAAVVAQITTRPLVGNSHKFSEIPISRSFHYYDSCLNYGGKKLLGI